MHRHADLPDPCVVPDPNRLTRADAPAIAIAVALLLVLIVEVVVAVSVLAQP